MWTRCSWTCAWALDLHLELQFITNYDDVDSMHLDLRLDLQFITNYDDVGSDAQ